MSLPHLTISACAALLLATAAPLAAVEMDRDRDRDELPAAQRATVIDGRVASLDTRADRIVISVDHPDASSDRSDRAGSRTVTLGDGAKVFIDDKEADIADLKIGDRVVASLDRERADRGEAVAHSVRVYRDRQAGNDARSHRRDRDAHERPNHRADDTEEHELEWKKRTSEPKSEQARD